MYKNSIDKARYMEAWWMQNREKQRKDCQRYYLEHKEELKERSRAYRVKNAKDISVQRKKRYAEVGRAIRVIYDEKNRGKLNAYARRFRKFHPESDRRHQSLRRNLEPISFYLNKWFEDSHLHHMGGRVGIFIPEALHRSVWHSLLKNYSMEEINRRSLKWMQNSKR